MATGNMLLTLNPLLDTDSYKLSHSEQYPPGMTYAQTYIAARKGGDYDRALFFGLRYIVDRYLLNELITDRDVAEAKEFYSRHGVPFNAQGWSNLVAAHPTSLPLRIRAVPEGTLVPAGEVMAVIDTTDERFPWLAGWFETQLLRVWYPTTVATVSWHVNDLMRRYFARTSDDLDLAGLPFKLHDFGARGASSRETAGIGGVAHLVNFRGSDTIAGLAVAADYYDEPMAGFSIPAAEHSTVTSWGQGRANEKRFFEHMLDRYPEGLVAVVSDTYDLWEAVDTWGELKEKVLTRDGTLVIRPDSGDPLLVLPTLLTRLEEKFGSRLNDKGYKVLNDHVRIIQGDGVNPQSIQRILDILSTFGWAIDNIAFGMGGALLQKVDRDTLRFAMKLSLVAVKGQRFPVRKTTATDPTKASLEGDLDLVRHYETGELVTIDRLRDGTRYASELVTYYADGKTPHVETLAQIRARADAAHK